MEEMIMFRMCELIAQEITEKGGTTVSTSGIRPINGYAVALEGYEQKIPIEEFDSTVVDAYCKQNKIQLDILNTFLGGWVNKGVVYLDVVRVENGYFTAKSLAVQNHQQAFYDLLEETEIFI